MLPIQNAVGARVVLPIRRLFNQLAVAVGVVQSVSPRQFREQYNRYQNFNCIGPGRDLLDAEKENDAAIGKLRGGLSTLQIECAKRLALAARPAADQA